jgi:hypothetical protein
MAGVTGLYQVALIGPERAKHDAVLRRTISLRAKEMGLSARRALKFLTGATLAKRDPRFPLVGVYFGGPAPTRTDVRHAEVLVAANAFVIPVVPTLEGFTAQVPEVLRGVNGLELDPADDELSRVARRVHESLDLLRSRRLAFISYRRVEASRLAQQLHHALDARCWQSFLDTHTVDPGVHFQPTLWDRMNDADVLVLLDSPGALESDWVAKEIEHANQLGMGVLQLVWPGQARDPRTLFATPFHLDKSDFVRGNLKGRGGLRLKETALRRVLVEVESLRARSVASRRDRMVSSFAVEARDAGLTPTFRGIDEIEVLGTAGPYRIFPVVGHLDSVIAHRREIRAAGNKALLLYDPTGLLEERLAHIKWLADKLPVGSLATTDVATWARSI